MGALLLEIYDIAVSAVVVGTEFYHCYGNVGAVVSHPFAVSKYIIENKALGEGSIAALQPLHMSQLHFVA